LSFFFSSLLKEAQVNESKKGFEPSQTIYKQTSTLAPNVNTVFPPGSNQPTNNNNTGHNNNQNNTNANVSAPKGDFTNLIGVGLIGALNNNGFSNTSVLASNLFANHASVEESGANKRLLSRFGCYLILSLVNPSEFGEIVSTFLSECSCLSLLNYSLKKIQKEIFGKILGMTLQWFHLVCHVPSDSSAELIAKLRTQVILIAF